VKVKIKLICKKINAFFCFYGLSIIQVLQSIRGTPRYFRDRNSFQKLLNRSSQWRFGRNYPCFADRYQNSGSASGHYFHQDLLVAQWIFERHPAHHIDVASRIDGFVAHVASFRSIEVYDIRPLDNKIPNIFFTQMDMMQVLPDKYIGRSDSVSCLHALEHFGLGRYNDKLDVDGYKLGLANLTKLLRPNGILYLSVPIGAQRIEFNAHRVFGLKYISELFSQHQLELLRFSYVDDQGDLQNNITLSDELLANNAGLHYGCGVFELQKRGIDK